VSRHAWFVASARSIPLRRQWSVSPHAPTEPHFEGIGQDRTSRQPHSGKPTRTAAVVVACPRRPIAAPATVPSIASAQKLDQVNQCPAPAPMQAECGTGVKSSPIHAAEPMPASIGYAPISMRPNIIGWSRGTAAQAKTSCAPHAD